MEEDGDEVEEHTPVLYGWAELVDSSVIFNSNAVNAAFQKLLDSNWDTDGPVWNEDFTVLQSLELLSWGEVPEELVDLLTPLVPTLMQEEYLTFEIRLRFGVAPSTMAAVMVNCKGVFTLSSSCMMEALQRRIEADGEEERDPAAEDRFVL
jgi:hypothetical protein